MATIPKIPCHHPLKITVIVESCKKKPVEDRIFFPSWIIHIFIYYYNYYDD